jgi:hypothetical protein
MSSSIEMGDFLALPRITLNKTGGACQRKCFGAAHTQAGMGQPIAAFPYRGARSAEKFV